MEFKLKSKHEQDGFFATDPAEITKQPGDHRQEVTHYQPNPQAKFDKAA